MLVQGGMRIATALLEELIDRAASSPSREICGLLSGTASRIERAEPAANVAADPAVRFELDPQALFAALRAERAGGPRLIGHYHSHPSGSAVPSACDAAAAEPGRYWLILGGGAARLWLARAGGFDEAVLTVD